MKSLFYILLIIILGCDSNLLSDSKIIPYENEFQKKIMTATHLRLKEKVIYKPDYFIIDYPMGDIPDGFGVCTDVVIRSYRTVGVDFQELVHNDIKKSINSYPLMEIWGQKNPDTNIDHRRVPNLEVFFKRNAESFSPSLNSNDYKPGDIVTWDLPGGSPWHIGIVSNHLNSNGIPLIIHNIGRGPVMTDILFSFNIRGHYRYDYLKNLIYLISIIFLLKISEGVSILTK